MPKSTTNKAKLLTDARANLMKATEELNDIMSDMTPKELEKAQKEECCNDRNDCKDPKETTEKIRFPDTFSTVSEYITYLNGKINYLEGRIQGLEYAVEQYSA